MPEGVSTRRALVAAGQSFSGRSTQSIKSALGKMMPSDDKKGKTNPAPKEPPPADKSTSNVDPSKAEGSEIAGAPPSDYSRGEGQKPVSQAYKDNWNAIFTKKKKR
jgi:hypothetical protein